ncbi:MAG: class I SAM-dependent methyltransferase [Phycisphaerales bacterium]
MVPGRSHYCAAYVRGGRAYAFAHQIDATLSFEPTSVLEVGAGVGAVTSTLRSVGVSVTTVDVQPDLDPDVVASVVELPFDDSAFDIAICCQVLEHLPFREFHRAISELFRVVRHGLVLSLPDISRPIEVSCRLPFIGRKSLQMSLRKRMSDLDQAKRLREMGHHWEIGYPGSRLRDCMREIQKLQPVHCQSWRVPELPWHRFFRIAKSTLPRDAPDK